MAFSSTTCRTCLGKNGNVIIFDKTKLIHAKLVACLKFQIAESDCLPQNICQTCLDKLSVSYEFIKQCEESNKLLKISILNKGTDSGLVITRKPKDEVIKSEDIDLETEPQYADEKINIKNELLSDIKLECDEDYVGTIDSDNDGSIDTPLIFKNLLNVSVKKLSQNMSDSKTPKVKPAKRSRKRKKLVKEKLSATVFCDLCGKEFSRTGYVGHLKAHQRGTVRVCTHCKREFLDYAAYTDHVKSKICRTFYQCKICKKEFGHEKLFENHVSTHIDIPCEICGKFFKKRSLRNHVRRTHYEEKGLACKVCGKTVKNKAKLCGHMRSVHRAKTKRFICDHCDYVTHSRLLMINHISRHFDMRPYTCRFCGMSFRIRKSIMDHVRLHTGERPYKCAVCFKGFAQKQNMKSHFRHNHKNIAYSELPKEQPLLRKTSLNTCK